ncbi:MAG: CocE/NonD family hydrolase, partial [Dehalococcoidia bacterium]|nr:CocE/NonD family hydrolase [Dehalococcoidia bacterium]
KGRDWLGAWQWPLPNEKRTDYYFGAGTSGTVKSVNDGLLSTIAPIAATTKDDYKVDYTVRSAETNPPGDPNAMPLDVSNFDEKGLTYTTQPLASDTEVTGHSLVRLWATSTAKDSDFFVFLRDVDEKGVSTVVSRGQLRASHRAISTPPYSYFGLPWHRSNKEDLMDLPGGQAVEVAIDLLPTSYIFRAGHRIRVTITGADEDTGGTPVIVPAPTVSVYRNSINASSITLPIIPPGSAPAAAKCTVSATGNYATMAALDRNFDAHVRAWQAAAGSSRAGDWTEFREHEKRITGAGAAGSGLDLGPNPPAMFCQ